MSKYCTVFPKLPREILTKLEESYEKIKRNFREGRFESSELNGAKFCEAVYRILEWKTSPTQTYTQFGKHIPDFGRALKRFENMSRFPDSVRLHLPRILTALYDIRNKRGVGHLSGDVDPNYMDAVFVVSCCDWALAELVRLFHGMKPEDAEKLVQSLVTKKLPIIWKIGEVKRVLSPNLSFKEKTLTLLYDEHPDFVVDSKLFRCVEHSNLSVFKRDILKPCHKDRLIEYNLRRGEVSLSPLGLRFVEDNIKLEA